MNGPRYSEAGKLYVILREVKPDGVSHVHGVLLVFGLWLLEDANSIDAQGSELRSGKLDECLLLPLAAHFEIGVDLAERRLILEDVYLVDIRLSGVIREHVWLSVMNGLRRYQE